MSEVTFDLLVRVSGYDDGVNDYHKKIPVKGFDKLIWHVKRELVELAKAYSMRGIIEVANIYKLTAGVTSEIVELVVRDKNSVLMILPYIEGVEFVFNDDGYQMLIVFTGDSIPLEVMSVIVKLLGKLVKRIEKWGLSEVSFMTGRSKLVVKID